MGWWKTVLKAVVGAACLVTAAAHGMMAEPPARNVVHNSNYCPHCLSAGGPGLTYAGGRTWPKALHGVCGDPHTGPLDHEAGGKFATKVITGKYTRGQRIAIKVKITAPHGGRFSFGICPVPDGADDAQERRAVTQKCFDSNLLTNVADGTPYWWFGKKPVGEYTMEFTLPPQLTCKRCVLQWHYETGNSCTIPGTPAQHTMSVNMVSCDKASVMEEFWNCADVSIRDTDSKSPVASTPPPKKKATPRSASQREGFATFRRGHHQVAAELAAVALVLAIAALTLPPALAASAAVAFLVWYAAPASAFALTAWRWCPPARKYR